MSGSGPEPPTARAVPSKSVIRPGYRRSTEGRPVRLQADVLGLYTSAPAGGLLTIPL